MILKMLWIEVIHSNNLEETYNQEAKGIIKNT
jgi:hypothetical protein